MTASAFDRRLLAMLKQPKFTKRAAEEIARLEAARRIHLPPGNYLSFIGWANDCEPDVPAGPFLGYYAFSDAEGVPDDLKVECHGVRLAYLSPDRLLAVLHSSVLDFDGERFVFVKGDEAGHG
jgi:hypothetical protein